MTRPASLLRSRNRANRRVPHVSPCQPDSCRVARYRGLSGISRKWLDVIAAMRLFARDSMSSSLPSDERALGYRALAAWMASRRVLTPSFR